MCLPTVGVGEQRTEVDPVRLARLKVMCKAFFYFFECLEAAVVDNRGYEWVSETQ